MPVESQELAAPPEPRLPARVDELPAGASIMQLIAVALIDERVQPEKMEKLLSIKRDIEKDDAEKAYNENFALMQNELPVIVKDTKIEVKGQVRSKYAKYSTISKAIRPVLNKYGFRTRANTHIEGKTVKVMVTIKRGLHQETTEVALPLDESEYRNVVQNYGATLTFCRRYALCFALDIIVEDQDTDAHFYELITESQRKNLESLIEINEMNEASISKFLEIVKAKSLSDILQKDYPGGAEATGAEARTDPPEGQEMTKEPPDPRRMGFASPEEAGRFLGLSRAMISKLTQNGTIPHIRLGGKSLRIPWTWLLAQVDEANGVEPKK